jgi:hypothetical protein
MSGLRFRGEVQSLDEWASEEIALELVMYHVMRNFRVELSSTKRFREGLVI